MHTGLATLCLILASPLTPRSGSGLLAQASPSRAEPDACIVVTSTDVEKVTGRPVRKTPSHTSDLKRTQSYCGYRDARVRVSLVSKASSAQKHVSQELQVGGYDQTRHSIAGLGDSSAIYFASPGRTPEAFLVAHAGARTLTIAVKADGGRPPESARPLALELARIALARLD